MKEEKNPSEVHWHIEQNPNQPKMSPSIFEYRKKWFWCDETGREGNDEGCDTLEQAKEEQQNYVKNVLGSKKAS